MHPLAEIAETAESVSFTAEEMKRVREFRIPGDRDPRQDPRFYPRKPTQNVAEWHADYWARLRSLERAAGVRRDPW